MFHGLAQDNGGPTALAGIPSSRLRNVNSKPSQTNGKNGRKCSSSELADDKEDLALIEEIEDFALEDITLEVVILYRSEASAVGGSLECDKFGPNVMCL
jgi:hypothetical protein